MRLSTSSALRRDREQLPPRGLNVKKQSEVHVVFGVSRTAGNTEHVTFFLKCNF
jgi:hypothetical protein